MTRIEDLLAAIAGLQRRDLESWIDEALVQPHTDSGVAVFSESDCARVRLICTLHYELDVEPGGSGRMLGLMSIAEVPRRLSLDFSDFFSKGFAFNTARGDFVFSGGKARTDNLRVDGPAAEIRVSGTTGMRDQTYDQRVEVLPKAGSVLPAIGMLAGGPAGAAVGLVAQAVLQKPLKQTTRVVYRVTGPWQKPDIEVIERGPAKSGTIAEEP